MIIVTSKPARQIEKSLDWEHGDFVRDARRRVHGQFTCLLASRYESWMLGDVLLVYTGRAMCGMKEMRPRSYGDLGTLLEDLREAVGFFTVFVIERTRIRVISSLYRHVDVLYAKDNGEIVISSQLAALLAIIGPRPVNARFMWEFANDDSQFGGDTFFDGVHQVPLGEAVTLDRWAAPRRRAWNIPAPCRVDFIEVLRQNILAYAGGEEQIIVQFSGGLDSSLVLHVAQQVTSRCVAQHLLSIDDPASEVEIARHVAGEFGVRFEVHTSPIRFAVPRSSFGLARAVSTPFDIHPLSPDPGDRNFAYDEQLRAVGMDRGFILTGEGGDYVFLQHPAPYVGWDGYLDRGWRGALVALKEYSQLKASPFLPLLGHNLRHALLGAPAKSGRVGRRPAGEPCPPHALLTCAAKRSAKFAHLQGVLMGLHQMKPNDDDTFRVIHPLFLQNILAGVIGEPVNRMFSADFDRIQIRRALARSSKSTAAWRRTKRPSSGLVFAFFRNNEALLKRLLCDGRVASTLSIDADWIRHRITENANLRTTEDVGTLLNMQRLEIFGQSHAKYID
ncbi:asparagine synthase-related protein [Cupriavidus pauculus]|uniref:Asparagine synthetase domain-containing protein n=1 Tax=Cupriavidus pauculus TaxID=82633 RepID=A0A2N5C6Q7_9BURK|nr:asparagine synthase-related protein [Cupriavidus pauculus]PLP97916.1 hypothetical protein CYJ10_24245 [Cupriavidus pauculus]